MPSSVKSGWTGTNRYGLVDVEMLDHDEGYLSLFKRAEHGDRKSLHFGKPPEPIGPGREERPLQAHHRRLERRRPTQSSPRGRAVTLYRNESQERGHVVRKASRVTSTSLG